MSVHGIGNVVAKKSSGFSTLRRTVVALAFMSVVSIGLLTVNTRSASAAPWCRGTLGYRAVYGGCELEKRWTQVRLVVRCEADALDWVFSRSSAWSPRMYFQSWQAYVSCGTTARPVSAYFEYKYV